MAPPRPELVKLSTLAAECGVPAATLKHYVREGLLPGPSERGRNVAYYDRALAPRIQRIKELQRSRFLPLKVIREVLDTEALPTEDATVGAAIARVLEARPSTERRSREDLIASGMPATELAWLEGIGLLAEQPGGGYAGDDLELLRVLGAARRAGLTAHMLPVSVLHRYAEAMQRLVTAELELFREGVIPHAAATGDLGTLAEAATTLSERLVVLLRRKLLLPTLERMVADERRAERPTPRRAAPRRSESPRGTPAAKKQPSRKRT